MPEIHGKCPSCATTLKLGSDLVGKSIRCPKCKTVFQFQPETPEAPNDALSFLDDPGPADGPNEALAFMNEPASRDDPRDDGDDGASPRHRRPSKSGGGMILLVVLGGLVLIGGGIGALFATGVIDLGSWFGNGQAENANGDAPAAPGELPKLTLPKPSATLMATELTEQVKNDPNGAKRKFNGKVVQIKGMIVSMGFRRRRDPLVLLRGHQPTSFASCVMKKGSRPWDFVMTGYTAEFRGKAIVEGTSVGMRDCEIVSMEEKPPARFSVTQLADLVIDKKEGVPEDGAWIIVKGKVSKVDLRSGVLGKKIEKIHFELRDGYSMLCEYETQFDEDDADQFEAGSTITLFGLFTGPFEDDKELHLDDVVVTDIEK